MTLPHFIGDYEFKSFNGIFWLKIFYHNCENGEFFSPEEVYNITTDDKYSILYILDKNVKIRNKFEFLLEYPELNKFNHWRQKNSPTKEKETTITGPYKVEGYQEIKIQMNTNDWGGLALSTNKNTFIEGSIGNQSSWFYAIGQYTEQWTDNKIASSDQPVNYVYLWLGLRKSLLFSCDKKIRVYLNIFSYIIIIL